MENGTRNKAARLASFLALLCLFLNFYIFSLLSGFSSVPRGLMWWAGILSPSGAVLCSFLCPFFLPSLGRNKGLLPGLTFILLIVLPNLILRSLGLELYITSVPVRTVIHLCTGMLYPVCVGLFFLTHRMGTTAGKHSWRFYIFIFSLPLVAGIITRFFSLHLLEISGLASDPQKAMSILFTIIKWLMAGIGAAIITCLLLLERPNSSAVYQGQKAANWPMIFRLIGFAALYNILNGLMGMRLFPALNNSGTGIHILLIGLTFPVFVLLAARSIERFMKYFFPLATCLFILLPCILFFENYPSFVLLMNTLVGILTNVIWIVFSAALVEYYSPDHSRVAWQRGFWFYGLASAIYIINIFSFTSPMLGRYIPAGIEFTVLISGIAAIGFLFISFRIIFPRGSSGPIQLAAEGSPGLPAFEDIFRDYGLTERETKIAALMLQEGLSNKEIAGRIFLAPITVKTHVTHIYQKFGVKGRSEFMSLFVRREN